MKAFTLVCLLTIFIFANVLLKPENGLIKPSEFYVNPLVSGGIWYYRMQSPLDYLILGNSRTKDGLDPAIIQNRLNQEMPGVKVHIISSGGGYFPFYYELLNSTLKNQLPKNVILGLSPRDFNKKEPRIHNVSSYLKSSYGYKLDNKPYNIAFKTVEKELTNLFAALFPILYYESHVKKVLFNRSLDKDVFQSGPLKTFNKYIVFLVRLIPKIEFSFDKSLSEYWRRYVDGILNVFGSPEPSAKITRWDGYQIPPVYSDEEYEKRNAVNQEKWKNIINGEDYKKYRSDPYCDSQVELETDEKSYLNKTFQLLLDNNIGVYIVQLPAIWLEGCENNLKFGQSITDYLAVLKSNYPNIKDIIDLNKNFKHEFQDPYVYADLEHLYPKNAGLASIPVAEKILQRDSERKSK